MTPEKPVIPVKFVCVEFLGAYKSSMAYRHTGKVQEIVHSCPIENLVPKSQ